MQRVPDIRSGSDIFPRNILKDIAFKDEIKYTVNCIKIISQADAIVTTLWE